MKKYTFFLFVVVLILACSDPGVSNSNEDLGQMVFDKNCKLCHGADGKQQLNGAKDLNLSKLSLDERVNIITNGKNVMVPFKGILSAEEIKAVAAYTKKTFK